MKISSNYFCNNVSKMDKPLKDILKEVMKERNIRVPKLSELTGIPKDRIYAWYRDDTNPKSEDSEILLKWISGEISNNKSYIESRFEKKNSDRPNIKVRGGFTNLSNITVYQDDPDKYEVVGELPQGLFPRCDYAERAKGDSMYPLIMNQALLVGKRCSIGGLVWGEKYIIKTREGLDTTKFVHPGADKNKILLIAHNKNVPPQEIDKKDIIFACRVNWIINPT
ncbi:MAG: hypothetical protein JST87_05510 [Bacteroidetes bacterium]|nr:hypothetical protein [Bacteroidota bacterium]